MTSTGTSDTRVTLPESEMRYARSAYKRRLPGLVAAAVAMAFLNATTLAPATHHPGPMHNPAKCSICVVQTSPASASCAPPPLPEQTAAPERVRVQAVAQPKPGAATPVAARDPPMA